jgi:acetyl-CoA synthetase
MDRPVSSGEIVWRPSPELMARSNLSRFIRLHGLTGLDQLQQRSTTDLDWFWTAVLADLDIRFRRPYTRVVDVSRGIAWPRWCLNGIMNIVDNCLDKYAGTGTDAKPAIKWEGEEGQVKVIAYAQLRRETNQMANGLRSLGLGKGDVIGIFMPMTPEIVVAMLAIVKIGAICLPLFSGFGPQAIRSRLEDAEARALLTADACLRRGKIICLKTVADEAVEQLPAVRHVVVFRRLGIDVPWRARDHWWHDLVAGARDAAATEPTAAEDPLMILYTSGTSGQPKGPVHTHCGFPVKAAQDMSQGLDLHPDETLFWITDLGWMMGPWLIFGTLLLGACMMLFDGALDYPEPDRLWALVEKHRVTSLGISPTLVRSLLRHGEQPVRRHDLSALRKFASTGEPWNPDPWLWLFHTAGGGRLPIINYSGGTEISGGILMGNVLTPVKPCAFSGPIPGMAADIFDDRGQPVRGQVGELVVRQPWIGMTRGFWRDSARYLESYWSRFPDVWLHGDWAATDPEGFWYILGRSDDTIKIGGKRLGPAEVESVLVNHPDVSEAAAIGVPDDLKGEALACFCILKPWARGDDLLREQLKKHVASELGRPLMPQTIRFVSDLPRTRNAKLMRRLIRAAYLGQDLGDISSLENPPALDEIRHAC